MTRKFVVTGGAGFIGSHISEALCKRGDEVTIIDNLSTGHEKNFAEFADQVQFVEADVRDKDALAKAFEGAEVVYHQAALASVPRSVEFPLDTNDACVTGTVNVLNEARKAGVRRVVYAASSSAYGDQPCSSKRETDLPMPLSPYAAAKLAGEYYCQAFHHTYGLETVGLRYFNVFGPRQDPDSPYSAVIPLFMTAMLAGERPTVYGDGQQSRDFTFVANVVHGNLLAADVDGVSGKIINTANGRTTSLIELIESLNRLLGTDIQPIHADARVGDVRDSLADISLAERLLKYSPQVYFEEGLERSVDYYRELVASRVSS